MNPFGSEGNYSTGLGNNLRDEIAIPMCFLGLPIVSLCLLVTMKGLEDREIEGYNFELVYSEYKDHLTFIQQAASPKVSNYNFRFLSRCLFVSVISIPGLLICFVNVLPIVRYSVQPSFDGEKP